MFIHVYWCEFTAGHRADQVFFGGPKLWARWCLNVGPAIDVPCEDGLELSLAFDVAESLDNPSSSQRSSCSDCILIHLIIWSIYIPY